MDAATRRIKEMRRLPEQPSRVLYSRTMSVTHDTNENVSTELDERDARALTTPMTVFEDGDAFEVTTDSGKCYETTPNTCECPDHQYRDERCKHIRRVEFETGRRAVPAWVDRDAIDQPFGEFVDGEPRFEADQASADKRVATDGGRVTESESRERGGVRPDYVEIGVDTEGGRHVYRTFDENVLVVEDGEISQRYALEPLGKSVNDWIAYVKSRRGGFEEQRLYESAEAALGGAIN